jgi:Zn-dependent metalloprotease
MNHQHAHTNTRCICHVIPPHILESIARNGTPEQRAMAQRSLAVDSGLRAQRTTQLQARMAGEETQAAGAPHKNRLIYTAANAETQPGTLVRSEGQGSNGDVVVDEAYDGFGTTFDLVWDIYKRNSIDGNGMDMLATVHYGNQYNNAFWDGSQMVFGDGDGKIFNRFTVSIDVIGHELAHGVTQHTAGLEYQNQSGALNESVSDVFGSLVKQRSLGQTADQADWLIGAGLLAAGIKGVALRSMKAPGTAYDDPLLGKDPQPDHMSKFVDTFDDNGGVHINSGIPNKAFYLAAIAIGGNAWDVAGNIWYRTMVDSRLSATAQFKDFARLTVDNAGTLYGDSVKTSVTQAWLDVGVDFRVHTAQGNTMQPGEVLNPDQSITSANARYTFTYQSDGNLVLYDGGKPRWASNTFGQPVGVCVMQEDGNLVINGPGGKLIWSSGTEGYSGSHLLVQDDGNVVIYRPPIWATNTGRK